MPIYETSENHSNPLLKTQWYRNSYEECKNAITKVCEELGYEVGAVEDTYKEMILDGRRYTISVKICSVSIRESAIYFRIEKDGYFDFNRGAKEIAFWYERLNLILSNKGKSLY